jgi:hypothetical protein
MPRCPATRRKTSRTPFIGTDTAADSTSLGAANIRIRDRRPSVVPSALLDRVLSRELVLKIVGAPRRL